MPISPLNVSQTPIHINLQASLASKMILTLLKVYTVTFIIFAVCSLNLGFIALASLTMLLWNAIEEIRFPTLKFEYKSAPPTTDLNKNRVAASKSDQAFFNHISSASILRSSPWKDVRANVIPAHLSTPSLQNSYPHLMQSHAELKAIKLKYMQEVLNYRDRCVEQLVSELDATLADDLEDMRLEASSSLNLRSVQSGIKPISTGRPQLRPPESHLKASEKKPLSPVKFSLEEGDSINERDKLNIVGDFSTVEIPPQAPPFTSPLEPALPSLKFDKQTEPVIGANAPPPPPLMQQNIDSQAMQAKANTIKHHAFAVRRALDRETPSLRSRSTDGMSMSEEAVYRLKKMQNKKVESVKPRNNNPQAKELTAFDALKAKMNSIKAATQSPGDRDDTEWSSPSPAKKASTPLVKPFKPFSPSKNFLNSPHSTSKVEKDVFNTPCKTPAIAKTQPSAKSSAQDSLNSSKISLTEGLDLALASPIKTLGFKPSMLGQTTQQQKAVIFSLQKDDPTELQQAQTQLGLKKIQELQVQTSQEKPISVKERAALLAKSNIGK
jgi:hypothetical protein